MGDSIRKAFRNVDDILKDMGYEANEENRKAVRILGYNSMDITDENIDAVKKYDMELQQTIRRMTPAASLQAIRDGKNPLTMSMSELNQYLDESGLDEAAKEEKFSKYLYKLEKSHAVSEQEREAYIGIYRMFRQLEKTDDAAVGSLLKEGAQISFGNLLTAMRSTKRQGMDYRVDDDFNGVDAIAKNKSITDQILSGFPNLGQESTQSGSFGQGKNGQNQGQPENYYHMLAGQIADSIEPEMAAQTELTAETTMEAFADAVRQQTADASMDAAYMHEQLQSYRGLENIEEAVVQELVAYRQPVTANNLEAAAALRRKPGTLYRKLRDLEDNKEHLESGEKTKGLMESLTEGLMEGLTDKENAQEAYEKMQESYTGLLEEAIDAPENYLDLCTLQSCKKQLALAGNLAREENYQIPVEINGELTAINLKVLHGGEAGRVGVTVQTEEYGQIAARFSLREQKVSGYVVCDTREGTQWLQGREEEIKNALETSGENGQAKEAGSVAILYSREINDNNYPQDELHTVTKEKTADLYHMAKAFIEALTA